jgi:hypothetical protein
LQFKCGIILSGRVGLYTNLSIRGVVQLVERASGGREAAGSSPVTPTNYKFLFETSLKFLLFFTCTKDLIIETSLRDISY